MLNFNRSKRPVDLGPYPLERLRRDPAVIAEEAARPPQDMGALASGPSSPLVRATITHLDAYEALREPEPFSQIAPVPDDLARRTRDIKGAGYFLDASQVGICVMPENGWLNGVSPSHSHAVVVLVEYYY